MKTPLIGITTYGRDAENRFFLRAEYIDAVRRAGGVPVLIPPGEMLAGELLLRLDGLILAGGGDVDPRLYGGQPHPAIYMVDPERDRSEIDLVRQAVQSGLPTLAICRGSQILNVALGGTLIEHLPDEVGEKILHRLPPRQPAEHAVAVRPGCKLAEILAQAELSPASWHHQAIRRPAPGLEVTARAPDGTIEAVELPAHPWLIAVQWHPELTAAADAAQQRLFDSLVQAAANKKI